MEKHIKSISNGHNHDICPKCYESIPNITGSYELDAVISQSKNKDMLGRLSMYVSSDLYDSRKMDK